MKKAKSRANPKENYVTGDGWYFFCKKCGQCIGRISHWEFKNFANGLVIKGMDLCLKCADIKYIKIK